MTKRVPVNHQIVLDVMKVLVAIVCEFLPRPPSKQPSFCRSIYMSTEVEFYSCKLCDIKV